VSHIQENEFEVTKARQQKKFQRFQESKNRQDSSDKAPKAGEHLDRWVLNLSHTDLNTHQKNVLSKGLNFAITPNTLPVEEFVVAIEDGSGQS